MQNPLVRLGFEGAKPQTQNAGKRDCYREAALELGHQLVEKSLDLVYGGGSIGLMGLVAKAVHAGGGHVLGIIPKPLVGKEVNFLELFL
ncbi:Cytokinin riboside 5-monophosphate phosphoribohydrolase LOG5 [Striga hermonthica]|uniref:Cytokinin riboside 5-monophosphate phosphoribohydrolase LOG5 n=1 Tax=Striga hermonthica TaxID=68872 RepID=A0A9N7MMB6_STRHE|nr:Cytokinin riboside 5-monophosphate phosphoribohydrolase LOG5 [Striga hermonthica]